MYWNPYTSSVHLRQRRFYFRCLLTLRCTLIPQQNIPDEVVLLWGPQIQTHTLAMLLIRIQEKYFPMSLCRSCFICFK